VTKALKTHMSLKCNPTSSPTIFEWSEIQCKGLTGDVPDPVSGHSLCTIEDKMYMFGGMVCILQCSKDLF
jgi:hypothetical protein